MNDQYGLLCIAICKLQYKKIRDLFLGKIRETSVLNKQEMEWTHEKV